MANFADDASLKNHSAKNTLTVRHFCEDCDIVIPQERIKDMNGRSVTRCLPCQEIHELLVKTGRRV